MNKNLQFRQRVLAVTEKDQRLHIARQYIDNIEIIDSLNSISWSDIFLRRIRLIGVPGKNDIHSTKELFKRKFIKWMGLSLGAKIAKANFEDNLIGDHGSKVLFAPAHGVALIYKKHLGPEYQVLELKDELNKYRMKAIAQKADRAKELNILDEQPGLTVFTNARNDMNIRSYKKIHPNRRIVLRYHDRLNTAGLGGRSPETTSLLKMIADLRRDGVVDEVESYCKLDAELMDGVYRPNAVDPRILEELQPTFRDALYRFIGGPKDLTDHSRIQALEAVHAELRRLYPTVDYWSERRMVKGLHNWSPYEQYLLEAARAEVMVDLCRISQEEGFSYRIPEALFLNRKIITNRLIVREEPFYSSQRVFLIGVDRISRLKEFLETDIEPLPESILRLYNSRLWWTNQDPATEKKRKQ